MNKKLYRSRSDCTIGGVCGGLGEYFGIDSTFIRLIFVLLLFMDGVSLLAYILAWIIIPQRPLNLVDAQESSSEGGTSKAELSDWNKYLPGGILIGIGVFFIIRQHYWWWHLDRFWPLALIAVGIFLIFRFGGNQKNNSRTTESLEGGSHESREV